MFKSILPGKNSGNWNFQANAEAAKVEMRMLRNNITIAQLSRDLGCTNATLVGFLKDGKHNKAYQLLNKRNWL